MLIAIGVLFYRSFTQETPKEVEVQPKGTTEVKLPEKLTSDDIIIYYDQDKVLEKSVFVQRLQKQAKVEIERHGKTYEKEEQAYAVWGNQQREMIQKGLLTQAEINKVQMQDEDWKVKLQDIGGKAEKAISEIEMGLIKKVQDAIKEAINILNKERKVKYVMIQTKSLQIFHPTDEAINITEQVITAIDDLNKGKK